MAALNKLCLAILSIFLIASCGSTPSNFQWLDVTAVPRANTQFEFVQGATYGDLADAYIQLKYECRATNYGLDELEEAQKQIRRLN